MNRKQKLAHRKGVRIVQKKKRKQSLEREQLATQKRCREAFEKRQEKLKEIFLPKELMPIDALEKITNRATESAVGVISGVSVGSPLLQVLGLIMGRTPFPGLVVLSSEDLIRKETTLINLCKEKGGEKGELSQKLVQPMAEDKS